MRIWKIEATGGFLVLIAWLNYLDQASIVPFAMLACTLHELGHFLAIRLVGGDIKLIRLTAVGAEMTLAKPLGYGQEGFAALAGPGVNLVVALLFCRWEWGILFSGLNLVLGCFNLLPVGQLDGGRAMYCTLALLIGSDWAQRISNWMNVILVFPITLSGLLVTCAGGSVTLLLVSLWLLLIFSKNKKRENRACFTRRKQIK